MGMKNTVSDSQEDWEAEMFSYCLLMPEKAFKTAYDIFRGDLYKIASYFGVTIGRAGMRAEMLKLLRD